MKRNPIRGARTHKDRVVGRVFTPEDVAEILKLTKRQVLDLLRQGTLKGVKAGRHWRIAEEAVDEYLGIKGGESHE